MIIILKLSKEQESIVYTAYMYVHVFHTTIFSYVLTLYIFVDIRVITTKQNIIDQAKFTLDYNLSHSLHIPVHCIVLPACCH